LKDVKQQLIEKKTPWDLVICCDTVVLFEGKIIEKPVTKRILAANMLHSLGGRKISL